NLENRYPRRGYAENTNPAAHLHGERVGRRLALHDRVSAPEFLERCAGRFVVAVLSRSALQPVDALRPKQPRAELRSAGRARTPVLHKLRSDICHPSAVTNSTGRRLATSLMMLL